MQRNACGRVRNNLRAHKDAPDDVLDDFSLLHKQPVLLRDNVDYVKANGIEGNQLARNKIRVVVLADFNCRFLLYLMALFDAGVIWSVELPCLKIRTWSPCLKPKS